MSNDVDMPTIYSVPHHAMPSSIQSIHTWRSEMAHKKDWIADDFFFILPRLIKCIFCFCFVNRQCVKGRNRILSPLHRKFLPRAMKMFVKKLNATCMGNEMRSDWLRYTSTSVFVVCSLTRHLLLFDFCSCRSPPPSPPRKFRSEKMYARNPIRHDHVTHTWIIMMDININLYMSRRSTLICAVNRRKC